MIMGISRGVRNKTGKRRTLAFTVPWLTIARVFPGIKKSDIAHGAGCIIWVFVLQEENFFIMEIPKSFQKWKKESVEKWKKGFVFF